jgi:type IV pilus assembly protein PilB
VKQVQVNPKTGLTFSTGLRAMVRADPDVIMVGEIRDAVTAQIAIESALTGHLVMSTLHANGAPLAAARLIDMGIEPFLVTSSVECVVAQRLVRRLCECKVPVKLTRHVLAENGFDQPRGFTAHEPGGCVRCGQSGYKGRTGLYEVMAMSDEIRDLTVERAAADEIRKVAVAQGMRPLRVDGFEKVKNGITSIAEVARVT